LDSGVLDPASECDLLVLIAGNLGELGAWGSSGLVVLGSDERKFAIGASRYVGSVIGCFLGALSKFAGLGSGLLLRLCTNVSRSSLEQETQR
jgi:hypothetical protein